MSFPQPALFAGEVVHRRISPVRHRLGYTVFSVLADLDNIAGLTNRCRLLSHNRWNALSLYDCDHADGEVPDLAWFVRDLVSRRLGFQPDRVFMLTFPRVFGYVFNPMTTYFCLTGEELTAVVYEVNNTFGGRVHYVCRVSADGSTQMVDQAGKRLLVSPFNGEHGRYGFRIATADERITLGVSLKEAGKPILTTSYRAARMEATDLNIMRLQIQMPLMTLKVIAAIHFEAAKLWLKGLRPPRPLGQALRGRHDRMIGSGDKGPDIKVPEAG